MNESHDDDALPSPPLLTISEVVQRLNGQIHSALSDSDGGRKDALGGFELHTRLPDGSSRPATDTEMSTADFQMKLQQTVQILQALPNKAAQLYWAEEQRTKGGNSYYQNQQYEQAMDVYLTLLAVSVGNEEVEVSMQEQQLILYSKLMNNLALCTLQLQRYQRAITFCTMALAHIRGTIEKWRSSTDQNDGGRRISCNPCVNDDSESFKSTNDDFSEVLEQQRGKLIYKLAKAYRLKGDYDCAQSNLNALQEQWKLLPHGKGKGCHSESTLEIDQWKTIVRKEEQLLQRAIAQEKLNFKRQQKAMRLLMTNDSTYTCGATQTQNPQPLYLGTSHPTGASKRKYSTLRAVQPPPPKTASKSASGTVSSCERRMDQALVQYCFEFWCWLFHLVSSWCFNGRRNH
jgi:tetratricopeptide (TPR) repeat protein